MSNKYKVLNGDVNALELRMRSSENKDEFRRFQTVWLRLSKGLSVKEIAQVTCYTESWVRQLHSLYRAGGLEVLFISKKGGRNNENMTLEQENEFIAPFLNKAKSGGILEVSEIHTTYEEFIGRKVSVSVVYLLLHRHGWRKISPRPSHPKSDEKVLESFKKNGQKSSTKLNRKP